MQNIGEIYQKYAQMVYKYIFCLTGNKDTAEEIVQETFVIAIKNISRYRGECKISTWLCQISKYLWYAKLRKEKGKKEIPLQDIENQIMAEEIEEQIENKQRKIKLYQKIQKLDEVTRNVIYLRILGNLTYKEIAEIMNKSENWARVVFFRGKQKMEEESHEERM